MSTTISDAIVVGGGPAGVSCALWLQQLGFHPTLVEQNTRCGGLQLSNPYTNTWIATSHDVHGADVAAAMHDNMVRHGVDMRLGERAVHANVSSLGVWLEMANGETLQGRYLVLAGGVAPKSGGFKSRLGLIVGPGHGVAKTNFEDARVAILGGGDSAFENFDFVSQRGAKEVVIFARSIRARAEMLDKVPPHCVVVGDYDVDEKNNTVNGQPFDQIVVLYGYEANRESLLGLDVLMKSNGFVWTNEDCQTSQERVFAVGELAQRAHPGCVTAMADGGVAAKALQRRLETTRTAKFAGMAKRAVALGKKALP